MSTPDDRKKIPFFIPGLVCKIRAKAGPAPVLMADQYSKALYLVPKARLRSLERVLLKVTGMDL